MSSRGGRAGQWIGTEVEGRFDQKLRGGSPVLGKGVTFGGLGVPPEERRSNPDGRTGTGPTLYLIHLSTTTLKIAEYTSYYHYIG